MIYESGEAGDVFSASGRARVGSLSNGELQVDFEGVALVGRDGIPKDIGNGMVRGKLVKVCIVVRQRTGSASDPTIVGQPPQVFTESAVDEEWASPFCAARR